MTLLELIENKHGKYRKAGSRYVGPCPKCGGDVGRSFVTKIGSDTGHCFACGNSLDVIGYLREFENKSCKEAHDLAGKECDKPNCPALEKCKKTGKKRHHNNTVTVPRQNRDDSDFTPTTADTPEELWRSKATALVDHAHQQLLQDQEQLAYLAGRGLDLDAVKKYRLGWLAQDLYRVRKAWGLQDELKGDGTPKKLWLPKGITIPTFSVDGILQRVRIRRPVVKESEVRYYWVPGSGNGTTILSPGRRAVLIVESDLCGLLINHLAGDIVTTIALGTSSADPKADCISYIDNAAIILVALDKDQAGEKGWQKWQKRFPIQAESLPVSTGKDPSEAWQQGADLRQWILDALPISLHPAKTAEKHCNVQQIAAKTAPQTTQPAPIAHALAPLVHTIKAVDGRHLHITDDPDAYRQLVKEGKIALTGAEIDAVKRTGATQAQAAVFLDIKEVFGGTIRPGMQLDPEKVWQFEI